MAKYCFDRCINEDEECINEDGNPRKIRKYAQRIFKDIFSEDALEEYLKDVKNYAQIEVVSTCA